MSCENSPQIRFYTANETVLDWWRKQPKGARSANLETLIMRGLGVCDEELQGIKEKFLDHDARLLHLERREDMVSLAFKALATQTANNEEFVEDLRNNILLMQEEQNEIRLLVGHLLEVQGRDDDTTDAQIDSTDDG